MKPGRQYIVSLFIIGPDALRGNGCAYFASSDGRDQTLRPVRILGAPGRTYVVWLKAADIFARAAGIGSTSYFCHGRAKLRILTDSIRNPSQATFRVFRIVDFRIRRAA